jgi:hypothetical protein
LPTAAAIQLRGLSLHAGLHQWLWKEVETMKRFVSVATTLTLAAALLFAFVPAAGAGRGTEASGTWTWVNTGVEAAELPNGGTHITYATEIGTWGGTFTGTSLDTFRAEFSPGPIYNGTLWIEFEGTVNGVSGTMLMRVTFHGIGDPMWGHWAIVKGSDGLEGLSGSGTWTSDWADEEMLDYVGHYTGTIRMH